MPKKTEKISTHTHSFSNVWEKSKESDAIHFFSEGYRSFLDTGKTERESAREICRMAEAAGYTAFEEFLKSKQSLKPGQGIYAVNRDKSVILIKGGKKNLSEGLRILGAHIDSPRLDLKPFPLYEEGGIGLLKTHYYGGIRKYQWVSMPLALHGVVCLKSGETLNISIGEDEKDPVFMISDLLPHLAKDQNEKKLGEGLTGEGLNVIFGSIPGDFDKDPIKAQLLALLNKQFGITEADFTSAELEIVPAGKARDAGLDRSMIAAYGQDDRVCAYAALKAILDSGTHDYFQVGMFMDKEEVGSMGNTGSESGYFEYILSELLALENEPNVDLALKRSLMRSQMLSADVTAAYDPNYPDVYDKRNSPTLGCGVVLMKYSGSRGKNGCNDANAEFLATVRRVFDDNHVQWQVGELGKVDQGGGGTIAYILANRGVDVLDCGVAVLSMHGPWEITSKADLYMTYQGYKAFVESV